jgi:restriction system protein
MLKLIYNYKGVNQMNDIPTYEEFMYPYLEKYSDEKIHSLKDFVEVLANQFNIDEELRNKRLPSGKDTYLRNRIGWAQTYLHKAGLLSRVDRGKYKITKLGMNFINDSKLNSLSKKDLQSIDEFKEFIMGETNNVEENKETLINDSKKETPYELVLNNHDTLKQTIKNELLEIILNASPEFFEELIIHLIVSMGYGGNLKEAGEKLGRTGDGGIDGVIKEDILGLENIYLQAKRYNKENTVGSRDIRDFIGSLVTKKGRKGIFITTSNFTISAIETAESSPNKIVLIDGDQLTEYMFEYNVGVQVEEVFPIKKIDFDFFEEE